MKYRNFDLMSSCSSWLISGNGQVIDRTIDRAMDGSLLAALETRILTVLASLPHLYTVYTTAVQQLLPD